MRDTWRALLSNLDPHDLNPPDADNITPDAELIFRCFEVFDPEETRVVIVGQDPYPGKGVATGLAFQVSKPPLPPSLRNVFKEVRRSYPDANCDLSDWGRQGVLLFNRSLTTRVGESNAHARFWRPITDAMIRSLSEFSKSKGTRLVFMLWGRNAQELRSLIDTEYHVLLEHSHPSPLSRKPFVGNGHFALCNQHLEHPIAW
jgi:uracil-DNA glycosylase